MAMALEGITVLDISQVAAAPTCARHLGDYGAEVIHVEHPVTGDSFRYLQQVVSESGGTVPSTINYYWENCNRNKRSLALDISKDDGRKILYKLIAKTDVVITNFRTHELQQYGLRYDDLQAINPRIICGNVSGYGKKGPDKDLPAYDVTAYWCRSGLGMALSFPGILAFGYRTGLGDNVAGLALAFGVMVSLFTREKTGHGQEIDISLMQTGFYQNSLDIAGVLATGLDTQDWRESPPRDIVAQAEKANAQVIGFYGLKSKNPLNATYLTRDSRLLNLTVIQSDRYWRPFCNAIGRKDLADDSKYQSSENRAVCCAALRQEIGQTIATRTLLEWIPLLQGIPFAPVQTLKEAVNDPQARASDSFVSYDHPIYGRFTALGSPVTLHETPANVRMPAPEFGQHTEEILLENGYTWDEIGRFKDAKLIP